MTGGLFFIYYSIDKLPCQEYYPLTSYSIVSLLITEKEGTFLVIKVTPCLSFFYKSNPIAEFITVARVRVYQVRR